MTAVLDIAPVAADPIHRAWWWDRVEDPESTTDELTEMCHRGQQPALGFWLARLRPRPIPDDLPPAPPARRWTDTDLIILAETLAGEGGTIAHRRQMLDDLATIAARHHLSADALGRAMGLYDELAGF